MADYQYVLAVHVDAAKRGQKRRNAEEHFGKKAVCGDLDARNMLQFTLRCL